MLRVNGATYKKEMMTLIGIQKQERVREIADSVLEHLTGGNLIGMLIRPEPD